jgi:hypothetical protein
VRQTSVQQCLDAIRAKAKELRDVFGQDASARALEWAALRVDLALREADEELLDLHQASLESHYCEDHLALRVRQGRTPAVRPGGPRGKIYIRRADLPINPARRHVPPADVAELASRLGIRG